MVPVCTPTDPAHCPGLGTGVALPQADVSPAERGYRCVGDAIAHCWVRGAPEKHGARISWVTQTAQPQLRRSGPGWY